MADNLLIHYDPAHPLHATWSHVNQHGELTSRITSGAIADAATVAEQHRVVVLIDSTYVHLNHVMIPTTNRQKMLRAIPFALEDQLAEDVDQFHFVAGKQESAFGTPVAGIRKDTLEAVLNTFQEAGINVDAIIPDAICSPVEAGHWSIVFHHGKALVQFDALIGTVIDKVNLPLLLQSSLNEAENKPDAITCYYLEGEESESRLEQIDPEVRSVYLAYNTHPLAVFCGGYDRVKALNLLQGQYKPRRKSTGQWYRWRLAASLATVWLFLYLGITIFEINRLSAMNQSLSAEIDNIYRKAFPESRRVVNARAQMEQKLDQLKGGGTASGSQFLALLSDSATVLASQQQIQIESIAYRNNRMDIGLSTTNLQSVETLNKELNARSPIAAEITSATSEKNRVKGNIRLQRSGA